MNEIFRNIDYRNRSIISVDFFQVIRYYLKSPCLNGASLVAQTVKNLPALRETWVQSLGQEDHLEKGTVIHSSIFSYRIPWTEESGGL